MSYSDGYSNLSPLSVSSKPVDRESCKICQKFVYYHQPILFCYRCRKVYHGTCLKFTNNRVFILQQINWNCEECCVLNDINYHCETCFSTISISSDNISTCNLCRKLIHSICLQNGYCLSCASNNISINVDLGELDRSEELTIERFYRNQPYFCPFDFYERNLVDFLPDVDNLSEQLQTCNSVLKSCNYYTKSEFCDFARNVTDCSCSFVSLNVDGMRTNFNKVKILNNEFNTENQICGYFICETNVTEDEAQTFFIDGYNKFVQNRISKTTNILKHKGSGLITFLSENFSKVTKCVDLCRSTYDFECLTLEVINKDSKCLLVNVYRSPSGDYNKFLALFGEILELANNYKEFKTYIFGDVNVNLYNPNSSRCREYLACIFSNGFLPMISRATHFASERATCIDHILCNDMSDIYSSCIFRAKISHHLPVCINLNLNIGNIERTGSAKPRVKVNEYLLNKFIADLRDIEKAISPVKSAQESFTDFITEFKISYDKWFVEPNNLSSRKFNNLRKDWITIGLAKSCESRRVLYETWQTNRSNHNWNIYVKYSRKLDALIDKAKYDYFCQKINENKDDLKKTWRLINNILGRKRQNKLLTFPEEDAAHNFNKYFVNVASDLVASSYPNDVDDDSFKNFLGQFDFDNENSLTDVVFKETDLMFFISKLSNSKGTYFAPKILKQVSYDLSSVLCKLFNKCVSEGYFPTELKVAKVIPLYKNKGDINDISNYRPISMLSVFSKIFEKLIHKALTDHLESHNILNDSQYGFRKKRSTLHALINAMENVCQSVDSKQHTLGIFVDFSKAFDVLNHSILLRKLSHYGIRGKILELLTSYLTERQQYVSYGGIESTILTTSTGVPQGSVLGPLLFIIFINDIVNISKMASFVLFADDLNLFVAHTCRATVYSLANSILKELYKYCISNKLIINFSKCCFIEFGFKACKDSFHLGILNNRFLKVERCKFLGIVINSTLNWNDQIDQVISQVSKSCGTLYRIRLHVPRKILRNIYMALIQPYLIYCIPLWGSSLSSEKMNKLFVLQKKCVRIVAGKTAKENGIFKHTKPIFRSLNILTVFNLYTYFTATEAMKVISTQSPCLLFNFFQPSVRSNRLLLPKFNYESLKKKSFVYNGSKIINYLINHDIPFFGLISLPVFKIRLKRHLLTIQGRSRSGDDAWLQCNHDIFSDIRL